MKQEDMDRRLDVIADYADRLVGTEDDANRDTMSVAQAIDELYESKVWVDEWLEQKPRPKNASNRFDAESRNRFSQWQEWKNQQRGRKGLTGRYVYMLHDGRKVEKALGSKVNRVHIRSERTLRPLKWFLKYRYEDRIPDVWDIAVKLAGSADKVTSKHTREAVAIYKRDVLTPKGVAKAVKQNRAKTIATRTKSYFDQLVALAATDEKAKEELVALMTYQREVLTSKRAA